MKQIIHYCFTSHNEVLFRDSDDDISIYLRNEKGGSFRKCFDDFSVCRIIDHDILPEFKCKSVYKLTDDQRFKVRQILVNDMHVPAWMVNRCL